QRLTGGGYLVRGGGDLLRSGEHLIRDLLDWTADGAGHEKAPYQCNHAERARSNDHPPVHLVQRAHGGLLSFAELIHICASADDPVPWLKIGDSGELGFGRGITGVLPLVFQELHVGNARLHALGHDVLDDLVSTVVLDVPYIFSVALTVLRD